MGVNLEKIMSYAVEHSISYEVAAKELGMVLSPEEQDQLQKLGGDPGENIDAFIVPKKDERPISNDEVAKEATNLLWKSAVAAVAFVAAPIVALGMGVGALISSCTKIEQNVPIVIEDNDEDIIKALEAFKGDLLGALAKIRNDLNAGFDRTVTLLEGLGFQLNEIYEALLNQGAKADEILKAINENTAEQNKRLDALAQGNEDIKALLQEILAAINKGNQIATNNNEVLTEILKKLGGIGENSTNSMALLKEILAEIKVNIEQNKDLSQKEQELMKEIIALITKAAQDGADLDGKTHALLKEILNQVMNGNEQDKNLNEKTHVLLKTILENLQNFNNDNKDLLQKLIEKVGAFDENTQVALDTIIKSLGKLGEDGNAYLEKILASVLDGNKVALDNHELIKVIVDKMSSLKPNEDGESIDLLKQILEEIVALAEQEKNMELDTQALIKDLINNFANYDLNTQKALALIIEKMDNLGETGKAAVEELLQAIKENTTVAKGTYLLVEALLDKVDKLGGKADEILEVISNIGVGEKVDLSKIEDMLAKLLEQEKANNKVLNNIDSKLGLVSVTLEGVKQQIDTGNEKVLAKLQEILNKIPEGCNCTHETLDITVLIEKLDKIIEEIKKDPKNEGILGDLGNLEDLLG